MTVSSPGIKTSDLILDLNQSVNPETFSSTSKTNITSTDINNNAKFSKKATGNNNASSRKSSKSSVALNTADLVLDLNTVANPEKFLESTPALTSKTATFKTSDLIQDLNLSVNPETFSQPIMLKSTELEWSDLGESTTPPLKTSDLIKDLNTAALDAPNKNIVEDGMQWDEKPTVVPASPETMIWGEEDESMSKTMQNMFEDSACMEWNDETTPVVNHVKRGSFTDVPKESRKPKKKSISKPSDKSNRKGSAFSTTSLMKEINAVNSPVTAAVNSESKAASVEVKFVAPVMSAPVVPEVKAKSYKHEFRQWKDASGEFSISARFSHGALKASNGTSPPSIYIFLIKPSTDNQEAEEKLMIPLESLSLSDREYLESVIPLSDWKKWNAQIDAYNLSKTNTSTKLDNIAVKASSSQEADSAASSSKAAVASNDSKEEKKRWEELKKPTEPLFVGPEKSGAINERNGKVGRNENEKEATQKTKSPEPIVPIKAVAAESSATSYKRELPIVKALPNNMAVANPSPSPRVISEVKTSTTLPVPITENRLSNFTNAEIEFLLGGVDKNVSSRRSSFSSEAFVTPERNVKDTFEEKRQMAEQTLPFQTKPIDTSSYRRHSIDAASYQNYIPPSKEIPSVYYDSSRSSSSYVPPSMPSYQPPISNANPPTAGTTSNTHPMMEIPRKPVRYVVKKNIPHPAVMPQLQPYVSTRPLPSNMIPAPAVTMPPSVMNVASTTPATLTYHSPHSRMSYVGRDVSTPSHITFAPPRLPSGLSGKPLSTNSNGFVPSTLNAPMHSNSMNDTRYSIYSSQPSSNLRPDDTLRNSASNVRNASHPPYYRF